MKYRTHKMVHRARRANGIPPKRKELSGLSRSEFKTLLKRNGHKIDRGFFSSNCISQRKNRLYRWRWWADEGFVVDISCPLNDFDRWGNSTERTVPFEDAFKRFDLQRCLEEN